MSTQTTASNAMGGIANEAKTVLHEAQDAASTLYRDVRGQAAENVTAEAKMVADRVEDVAGALRSSSDKLQENEQWLARLMATGAEELGDIAGTLRANDLRGLVGQVETFARRQPSLFTGAAVAAGFVAARIARQSLRATSGSAR